MTLEALSRIAAAFAFVTLGVAILMKVQAPFPVATDDASSLAAKFSGVEPILIVELPIDTRELTSLVGTREAALEANTCFDSWLITAYTVMFLSWAVLLPGDRRIAWTAIAAALAAAAFDFLENRAIFDACKTIGDEVVHDLQLAGSLKWCAFFLTAMLLASRFPGATLLPRIAAVLHAVTAFAGLVVSSAALAVAMGALPVERLSAIRPLIQGSMKAVLGLMLLEALVLAIRPSLLVGGAAAGATLFGVIGLRGR